MIFPSSSVSMRALCFGTGPSLDLDAAAAEGQAFLSTRSSERKEMVALNDRLASYIEKVRPHPSDLNLDPLKCFCWLAFLFIFTVLVAQYLFTNSLNHSMKPVPTFPQSTFSKTLPTWFLLRF